ncbi:HD-GYP domain-containing protein [Actinospica durhamensis]|uniref:HD-GYP domain-containing protein n=1 Tax=Actinospica durhamensis TaxID=1508375 RepID=A0A941ERP3_9ACTN|nr:HD-GYP domain-containing protein [Actinospica durhamensis]MBR7835252.1 HD-GYP domain-containing protein [Actinospica durhamensis]
MPQRARYLCAAVLAAAALTAAFILPRTHWHAVPRAPFVILLSLLVVLVLTVRLPLLRESPAGPAMVSVLLASVVLLPPGAAALVGATASLFMVLRRADPLRVAFACAVAFLAAAAGGELYTGVHGCRALTASQFPAVLLPIALAMAAVSAVPAILVETYLVTATGRDRALAVREVVLNAFPRNVAYAGVGLLTAVLWSDSYDALAALVLLGPVVVTRWATVQAEEQRAAHDSIIRTLVQAVEIKDLYTRGHSERVARLTGMIAAELRLPPERVEVLRYAATLHDVGKLGVPTRLLRKTGPLDEAEFREIRLHPARGVAVVGEIAFLDEAYSAILYHHERMDGSGYPKGLRGEAIPPFARIIAVADAFDAMTSTRSYRQARSVEEALAELRACSGTQLDPSFVDAIISALAKAAAAGRVWRGDGSGAEPGEPPVTAAALPPGAVVAEFDHDDLEYQGPSRPAGPAHGSGESEAEAALLSPEAGDEDDAGCVAPSARRRAGSAAAGPVRSATEQVSSANSSTDLERLSGAPAEAFEIGRNGHSNIVSPGVFGTVGAGVAAVPGAAGVVGTTGVSGAVDEEAQDAAVRASGLSLPTQTGHDLDVLDPAETAADPRESR